MFALPFESTIGPVPVYHPAQHKFHAGNGEVIFPSLPGFFGTVFPQAEGLRQFTVLTSMRHTFSPGEGVVAMRNLSSTISAPLDISEKLL
jgi:hypothetical protein